LIAPPSCCRSLGQLACIEALRSSGVYDIEWVVLWRQPTGYWLGRRAQTLCTACQHLMAEQLARPRDPYRDECRVSGEQTGESKRDERSRERDARMVHHCLAGACGRRGAFACLHVRVGARGVGASPATQYMQYGESTIRHAL